MERHKALFVAALLAAWPASVLGASVTWDDPAGDVKPPSNIPDLPTLDIVRVQARSGDGALHLTVRLKESLEKFFRYTYPDGKKGGGTIAQFFLDADNNADTGGHPGWAREASRPLKGYEFEVILHLGYRFGGDKGFTGSATGDTLIDPKAHKVVEAISSFGIAKIKQGSDSYDFSGFKLPADSREKMPRLTRWKGDTVELSVPYDWLGLKPGGTIRLCFKERGEGAASGKGFSDDRTLKLDP